MMYEQEIHQPVFDIPGYLVRFADGKTSFYWKIRGTNRGNN